MEDNYYNPQNIEAYLRGKLSNADQEFFENEVSKDPLLQNELSLQRDIISSLKEHRKLDLKRRLNAIEIKTPWYYSTPMKVAASFSTIAIVAIFSFLEFNSSGQKNSEMVAEKTTLIDSVVSTQESNAPLATITPQPKTTNIEPERAEKLVTKKKISKVEEELEEDVKPAVPAFNDNYNEEIFNPDQSLKIPEGNVVPSNEHKSSDIQVQIASTSEHNFHYQFYNNKLFLFCDFSSGPYELLELHNKKSRDLYLFYNSNYYEIKHNQHEVAPLKQLRNTNLIKQLSIIKDK